MAFSTMNGYSRRSVLVALASLTGTGICSRGAESPYERDLQQERDQAEEHFKGPLGPLTLIARFSPKEGKSSIGKDPSATLVVPVATAHQSIGEISVSGGKAVLQFAPGVIAAANGKQLNSIEASSQSSQPVAVTVGTLSMHLYFIRGEQLQISVSDPNAPLRQEAQPLSWFPIDNKQRIVADWIAYPQAKKVFVADNDGGSRERVIPGFVAFEMNGQKLRLTAVLRPENPKLFFVFGDATNGHETYGAGRFLDADPPRDGKVTLDFNQAHNPLCAYNHEYLCPVAPKENRLPIPIRAGERKYPGSHS